MAGRGWLGAGAPREWRRAVTGLATVAAFLAGSAAASPPASAAGPAVPGPAPTAPVSAEVHAAGVRVVSYHGYRVTVPATWPVYNLAADPARCVLFNRHAVYLGTPGAHQVCPARAFGRTGALLIQPSGSAARAHPAVSHEFQVKAAKAGVTVTATYGADQSQVRSILAGATQTAGASAPGVSAPGVSAPGVSAVGRGASPASGTAAPGRTAVPASAAPGLRGVAGAGLGFDACTAPSVATMTAWLASPYRMMGTYLGGVNWACDYGNFTSDWVRRVSAEGWRFIPIWVGEQASCSAIPGAALINPANAAAEGRAEAGSAVSTARSFGYGPGSTLYFDMEGYDKSDATCVRGVLTFLSAWTRGLHSAGYKSGVYSSAGSGITNLASEYGATSYDGAPYTGPDDIWIADWDGNPQLFADPYVSDRDWPAGRRLRQYAGGHSETWGGDTLTIDSDIIGGPVDSLPGAHVDAGPSRLSGPDAVTAAPGGRAKVTLTLRGSAATPAAYGWRAVPPAGLTVSPASGTVTIPPGAPASVRFTLRPGASLAPGRYEVPVTFTAGGKTVAETFEMVSVTASGASLPTAHPIVLYAADAASMTSAEAVAKADALPSGDVTGRFTQAWTDLAGGKDLVIAVGDAAVDGLFYDACGWDGPSGPVAGGTPFYWLGSPFRQSPGADIYEPADGTTGANSALLAAQLTHFALTGSLADYGRPPTRLPRPVKTCLGSADVPVP